MKAVLDRLTRLFGFHFGPNAAAEWVVGTLLTRGTPFAASAIAAGQTLTADIDCAGDSELTVMADMSGAANGDLTVFVTPFESDNVTTMGQTGALPAIRSTGPTFDTVNRVLFDGTYDVSGYSKVRLAIKNNNVGAQTINRASWRLS